jgi:hypothetical protein
MPLRRSSRGGGFRLGGGAGAKAHMVRHGDAQAGQHQVPRQWNSRTGVAVDPPETMETVMLRGGLLWMIGIPLPIILILFFLGYLS